MSPPKAGKERRTTAIVLDKVFGDYKVFGD